MNSIGNNRKRFRNLLISITMGLIIGSFLTQLFVLLPNSVVKDFFTNSVSFGFGFNPDGALLDLGAVKFKFGFTCKFSFLSLIGMAISVYMFRWYYD